MSRILFPYFSVVHIVNSIPYCQEVSSLPRTSWPYHYLYMHNCASSFGWNLISSSAFEKCNSFNLAIFSSGMRTGVFDFSYKQTMFALINSFGMRIQKSNSYLQTFIRRFLLVKYRPIRTSVASGCSARRTFPYRVVQGKYLKLIWKFALSTRYS